MNSRTAGWEGRCSVQKREERRGRKAPLTDLEFRADWRRRLETKEREGQVTGTC